LLGKRSLFTGEAIRSLCYQEAEKEGIMIDAFVQEAALLAEGNITQACEQRWLFSQIIASL
jgi:hypothetical protein